MKHLLTQAAMIACAANLFSQTAVSPATATNESSRNFGRGTPNSNDVFYTLGPDSKPRDGVPKGKYSDAKVLPSKVFPGTQHTYWVYVPAQYDSNQPTALMIF